MWKQRIIQAIWILAGAGTITLLVAAMQKKSARPFANTQVEISGATGHVFVDERDVQAILEKKRTTTGVSMADIDLRAVEEALEKDPWIRNAELFFDNRLVLQVRITEREPVARIFTSGGRSFYLDTTGKMLPLSEKLAARVPVFTGVPFGRKLSATDSALMESIITLSQFILADSFWNAQIGQVHVEGNAFEMSPVIGNHIILFGDITDMERKFRKLFGFYRTVSAKAGFDAYETINLMYEGQVVATRRGATAPMVDSAGAVAQLQRSLEAGQQAAQDTVKTQGTKETTGKAVRATTPKAVMTRQR